LAILIDGLNRMDSHLSALLASMVISRHFFYS